jgi:hypothetical protein
MPCGDSSQRGAGPHVGSSKCAQEIIDDQAEQFVQLQNASVTEMETDASSFRLSPWQVAPLDAAESEAEFTSSVSIR